MNLCGHSVMACARSFAFFRSVGGRGLRRRFFSDALWRDSAVMFFSSVLVNIFNLVFWLFLVRRLIPDEYAILNSLVALMSLFCVPLGVVQTVVTRYVSRWKAMGKTEEIGCLLKFFFKRLVIFSLGVGLIFLIGERPISIFLQLPASPWMPLVVCGVVFSAFATLTLGVLYGSQRFIELSLDSVLSGVVKLAGGWLFVSLGWAVFGGLLGFVVSFLFLFVVSGIQIVPQLPLEKGSCPKHLLDRKEIYRYFLPSALCVFSLFALTNMDIILVKHFFTPLEAGHYSVAQIVGRIVLFLPGAIGVVMFPKIAEAQARQSTGRGILLSCLAIVGALCGLAVIFSCLFPGLILKVLTGHQHPEAIALVKWFALSMSFYAMVNIFGLYFLSLHKNGFIGVMTGAVAVQALALWFFHSSLTRVLVTLFVMSLGLTLAGLFFMGRIFSHEKS